MNDDWRLHVRLADHAQARELIEELGAHALSDQAERSLHDRVVVSVDGPEVFCYSGTRQQAEEVEQTVEQLASVHAWSPQYELRHWHPTAERWEEPDVPLAENDAQRAEEVRQRVEQERADSLSQGYPDYEVRVECPSRALAAELADRLREDGIPVVHRWSTVLVGATDEASASELAEMLRRESPENSMVTVEGNMRAIFNERPWRPFAFLGGLAG
jgi:hypothetical protein